MEKNVNIIVGENIRRFRTDAGLSLTELAKAVGVSHTSVSLWESGKTFPRSANFTELSWVLNVPIDEIMGDSIRRDNSETVDIISLLQSPTPISFEGEPFSDEQKYRLILVIEAIYSKNKKG